MSHTITQAKNDLSGMIHSTNLNDVQNVDQLLERAARNLLSRLDPADTILIAQITNAVHDDIVDYSVPSDIKGNAIIDIRPQANRGLSEQFSQQFARRFDVYRSKGSFHIRYNKGVKSLRLSADISPSPTTLHQNDHLTNNGTWAADGTGASNLTRDILNYITSSASLNFDLAAGQATGYIENSTLTAVDLSTQENISQLFLWVSFPDPSIITNVILRWGSSSSAYWSATATAPHDQSTFKTGWQIIRFNWDGATKTGSPDSSAINYLRITITYDGTAETDIRVNKLACSAGEIYEIEYYSECLFSTSGGTWGVAITDDSNTINLDEDGYNIFLYEGLLAISQQQQGEAADFDQKFAARMLFGDKTSSIPEERKGLYEQYEENHPSQRIKIRGIYGDWKTYARRFK